MAAAVTLTMAAVVIYGSGCWIRGIPDLVSLVHFGRLSYDFRQQRWNVTFSNVKPDAFDHCCLVWYTPHGLYIGYWDSGAKYFHKMGSRTDFQGGRIRVQARKYLDWEASLEVLLRDKIPGVLRAFMPWSSLVKTDARTS